MMEDNPLISVSQEVKEAKKKVDDIRENIEENIDELKEIVLDECDESKNIKDEYKEDMEDALLYLKKAKRKMKPPEK